MLGADINCENSDINDNEDCHKSIIIIYNKNGYLQLLVFNSSTNFTVPQMWD